ncbi:hypothetical protein BAL199_17973 [alpha proteobacterium BAL199]|nr:hypothetical protein BAL199_17973 [alpha proteobacterium BAL199]
MPVAAPADDAITLDDPRPLDLDEQRSNARDLHRGIAAGEPEALRRVRARHPRAIGMPDDRLAAAFGHPDDAQLVIARELGLPSWPALVAHAGRLAEARRSMTTDARAPDGDCPTLHLRCGSDIRDALQTAGFVGDFLEVSDPICQGPVPNNGDLFTARAAFLADAYGLTADEARSRLENEAAGLAAAAHRYQRVVLWFEHDSYDQLILARVLAAFAENVRPATLDVICIDRFPLIDRFTGLGMLSPIELRSLWSTRTPVVDTQFALGREVWAAMRDPSPQALHTIAAAGTPELPAMAPALHRHLQDLPWTNDGLALTERLVLQALRDEPTTAGRVFVTLHDETEPLPFLGDLMFWAILSSMLRASRPPFAIDPLTAHEPWPRRRLVLTYDGHDILDSRLDWLACQPPLRWLGGVAIRSDADQWRWSPDQDAPVSAGPR